MKCTITTPWVNFLLVGDQNVRTECEPDILDPAGNSHIFGQPSLHLTSLPATDTSTMLCTKWGKSYASPLGLYPCWLCKWGLVGEVHVVQNLELADYTINDMDHRLH